VSRPAAMAKTEVCPAETVLSTAVWPFAPVGPGQLAVQTGDCVEVVEEDASGCIYARVHGDSQSAASLPYSEGWLPSWAVAPKQAPEGAKRAGADAGAWSAIKGRPHNSSGSPQFALTVASLSGKSLYIENLSGLVTLAHLRALVAKDLGMPHAQVQLCNGARTFSANEMGQILDSLGLDQRSRLTYVTVPLESRLGVDIFEVSAPHTAANIVEITLSRGDLVEVVEAHASGWTYGIKLDLTSKASLGEGWFPAWAILQPPSRMAPPPAG